MTPRTAEEIRASRQAARGALMRTTKHEARACQQRGGDWIARCSCEWMGPVRRKSASAVRDVERHLAGSPS